MSTMIEQVRAVLDDTVKRVRTDFPEATIGEASAYAWGYMLGQFARMGLSTKELPALLFQRSGIRPEAMKLDELVGGIAACISEVVRSIPLNMLEQEPGEVVEEMACRFVLEAVKHGIIIVDRVSYDRLIRDNSDLKHALGKRESELDTLRRAIAFERN